MLSRFSRGVSGWTELFGFSLLTITLVCGTTLKETLKTIGTGVVTKSNEELLVMIRQLQIIKDVCLSIMIIFYQSAVCLKAVSVAN